MFLVPFNKKSILDSTSSSPSQSPTTLTDLLAGSQSFTNDREIKQQRVLAFIIRASTFATKIFIESLASLKRWLNLSLEASLGIPKRILNRTSLSSALAISKFASNQLVWQKPISDQNISSLDINNLRAIIGERNWNALAAEGSFKSNHYYNNTSNSTPHHHCEMDLCRRRIAQRATSHNNHVVHTSSSYWDYSVTSPIQKNTSVPLGLLENGEAQQLHFEQQTPIEFQGQQRSCGLQTESSATSPGTREFQQRQQQFQSSQHDLQAPKSFKYPTYTTQSSSAIVSLMNACQQQKQDGHQNSMHINANLKQVRQDNVETEVETTSMVLVSREALSDLTDQIAFSMRKMRELEEQVRVIPELQRRLEHVISDSSSVKDFNHNVQRDSRFILNKTALGENDFINGRHISDTEDILRSINPAHHASNNIKTPFYNLSRNHNGSGTLSLQTTPVKTQLDCGCQSFKEHLRYNSISREQRLNHVKSQSVSTNNTSNNLSQSSCHHMDASTNTDLSMDDIVTRVELNNLITSMQKTYSILSSTIAYRKETHRFKRNLHESSSSVSESNSGSISGPKSLSPVDDSRSDSCENDEQVDDDDYDENDEVEDSKSECSSKQVIEDESEKHRTAHVSDEGEEEIETNAGSLNGEEPYSLGSSYQDPSDFEEYCAYGESLDRRTKDFMSQSTKIPNDLRFALIRLNDFIKRKHSFDQIESSSSCIEVIRKEWFEVSANKDSQATKTKLYVDYFESFTKQLLNTVVNLVDSAGNTAMHYAASHYKLDIIKVLLGTKVCDVNCRNKAGYTPIMLSALAEIESPEEQEVAKHLFSMGDVNIKARSSGQTALMLAASHGRIATCKLLLECGADPSLQDYDGSTALMCGSELGNEAIVRCLLAHKLTDPTAIDNDGLDALTIAMNNGHKNIGLILYAAKNVPRMINRSTINLSNPMYNMSGSYLGASMRRSRGKLAKNYVKRADSLLGSRNGRPIKHSELL